MKRCVHVCEDTCTGVQELVAQRVCVYVYTQHTQANRTDAYLLQLGQQEGGGGVSQHTSSREFARSSLKIKLGDSGEDNVSKGDSNDSRKGTGSDADGSDIAWSVSELISFLTSAITILPFFFQHHTAWLPVELGINERKSGKYPPVCGRSEFFWDMFGELSDFGSCGGSIFSFGAQPNCLA